MKHFAVYTDTANLELGRGATRVHQNEHGGGTALVSRFRHVTDYQKGFGGHFHNDNALGVLRDIPGLVIASPARPDDAAAMLRTCVAAARVDGSVSVFLEPIALYHTRDLYEEGDGAWLSPYLEPSAWSETHVAIGERRTHLEGNDLTLVTFGNGLYMSLRVARRLQREFGIRCRVLDLRWLSPLPIADLLREANATGNVLVVDETRKTGSVADTYHSGAWLGSPA